MFFRIFQIKVFWSVLNYLSKNALSFPFSNDQPRTFHFPNWVKPIKIYEKIEFSSKNLNTPKPITRTFQNIYHQNTPNSNFKNIPKHSIHIRFDLFVFWILELILSNEHVKCGYVATWLQTNVDQMWSLL